MEVQLKSVPVFINVTGQLTVDYRIFVACRDGRVYQIRDGKVQDQVITIESKPVGLLRLDKQIVIAGMDNIIQSYYLKGKKSFSMTMPSEICAMTRLSISRSVASNNILVALKNGNIRLYNEKHLINQISTDDICNGIVFGVFGREEGCLVINHHSGGLQAKILQRQAKLTTSSIRPGPPPEQDIPLKVP